MKTSPVPRTKPIRITDSLVTKTDIERMTLRELQGDRSVESVLEKDPALWRTALVGFLGQIASALVTLNGDEATMKTRCMAQGYAGKKKWFDYSTRSAQERSELSASRMMVENRLREVKQMRQVERAAADVVNKERYIILSIRRLEKMLDLEPLDGRDLE